LTGEFLTDPALLKRGYEERKFLEDIAKTSEVFTRGFVRKIAGIFRLFCRGQRLPRLPKSGRIA